jgi:hypothetical protein
MHEVARRIYYFVQYAYLSWYRGRLLQGGRVARGLTPGRGTSFLRFAERPHFVVRYRVLYAGMQPTIHLHVEPRLRIPGTAPPLPRMPLWRGAWLGTGAILYSAIFTELQVVIDGLINRLFDYAL